MSPTIKNVALAGARGNVGSQVLKALLDLEFNVTVLVRDSRPVPTTARVQVVDFTSKESLAAALAGQDAVIDATFSPDIETPLRLIDAAAESGVYRFITSDFGLDPDLPGVHDMPVFARKKASYEAVKKHAAQKNGFTYTLVASGCFLDWSITSGFAGIDIQARSASIFGDGNNVVPWTMLEDVGKATATVLLHPQETLNRPVYIHSIFMSQNQLVSAVKEVLGAEQEDEGGDGDGWETKYNRNMESLLEDALADLQAGRISAATFEVQIQYCMATKALAHPWKRDDNPLLGLEEWDEERLKGMIRTLVQDS